MCFGFSKEHPEHLFRLRNEKNNFQLRTLILGPAYKSCLPRSAASSNFSIHANCVDPDQTAWSSLIWVHTVCFYDVLKDE